MRRIAALLVVLASLTHASARAFASGDHEALRRTIIAEFGPALPPDEVKAQGELFARHEAFFVHHAARRMRLDGARWEVANYYDRAKIFYMYFARTGDVKYLDFANEIALNYRENFIEKTNYGPSAHWSQMTGLYLHFLATGDPASRIAVVKVGELFSLPYYLDNLDSVAGEMDNRIQARTIQALLYAYRVARMDATAQGRRNAETWAGRLREALSRIGASQSPDGAFRFQQVQCGYNKPFMVGLLVDALIEYHDLFEKDPRISQIIKASLRYLWERNWRAASRSFVYLEARCGEDGPIPAPDLNNLIVSGFGFMFDRTGDETYRRRGDEILAGAVNGSSLAVAKIFNQNYYSAYRYTAYRASARTRSAR